ncbi:pyridoxal-phosphate dependent enzyme [Nonomuraea sediminis]|uniref:pyridoxal-phosphate dependent enzyme n=1 Tax=Nonomuraea sediminis TaxID=2835864 RepID=UPI00202A83F8|nr:pyridoxal-phosphate dependent enzyme [Nonomuraea sediminis]
MILPDVRAAAERIRGHVLRTPVYEVAPGLFFKLEQLQHSGSFKVRGAFNRILSAGKLPEAGVIAASGGNHGLAVAYAARSLGVRAEIFVPTVTSPVKVAGLRALGAHITQTGSIYSEAAEAAAKRAAETGALEVHAYDQPEVVAGQGTVGLEIMEQTGGVDTILVAVGGGGLIAGITLGSGALRVEGVQEAGTATGQPGIVSATATEGGTVSDAGNARGAVGEARGEAGNVRGAGGEARGEAGNVRGAGGNARGAVGEARGEAGKARGEAGEARGEAGNAHGVAGSARGSAGEIGREGGSRVLRGEGGPRVVAVEPELTHAMHSALEAGRPVPVKVSGVGADALGATKVGVLAYDIVSRAGVESVLVSDEAIIEARRTLWEEHRLAVEHAGATAYAALLAGAYVPELGERVAVLVCGSNTDPATLVQRQG